MCGIIGAAATSDVAHRLLEGLKRLEYRGYDSAGIALIDDTGELQRMKIEGKVRVLADAVEQSQLSGLTGIAHTRWATHGKPSDLNAHPHFSRDELAVVHNGIIENHAELRKRLTALEYVFISETDSEVAAHLIHYYYQQHEDLLQAVQQAAKEMHGAFALGVIHKHRPHEIVAIRKGSPLVVGIGLHQHFIASDSVALHGFAESVIYLEEGDSVLLSANECLVVDRHNQPVERISHTLEPMEASSEKGSYRHFMLKEIFEQSKVLRDTLEGRIASPEVIRSSFGDRAMSLFPNIRCIHIVACGTSYHAGLIAHYWLESLSGIPTRVEIASEFRYRDVVVPEGTLFITVSQSGETADTLAALRKAKTMPYLGTLAICNVANSTLVREIECAFLTRAGMEIGVASTKAFTTQLTAFLMLAAALCKDERADTVLKQLRTLPRCCDQTLKMNKTIEHLAKQFVNKSHTLFLGRGAQYPVALEGALKLKEISYIHAEAYPAGELKHGPLALVDESMPVVAVAPNDELLEKLKSNLHEVSARGGKLFVFVNDARDWETNGAELIKVPDCGQWIAPIIYTIPLQLLAYHVAVAKGTDVDQPRNLAKSVTVE